MKRKVLTAVIAVLFAVLIGFGIFAAARLSEPVPTPTPEITPSPTPVPTPSPTPEPELPAGEAVTVDGRELSGSVVSGDVMYVPADEFFSALGLEYSESGGIIKVTWRDDTVKLGGAGTEPITYRGALHIPVQPVCEKMGISLYHDEELEHLYCTPGAGDWELPEGYRVPVFMYHYVTDDIGRSWNYAELFVSPEEMEEQLKYIVDNGYQPIWFEDLEHIDEYEKPLILTFDDGRLDNYYNLYPLLQKYNVKATFFVVSDYMLYQPNVCMYPEILKELADSGLVSIQSHTKSHPYLSGMNEEAQRKEMGESKLEITRATGKEPFVLCYPSGSYNNKTLEVIGDYYRFGLMMSGRTYVTGRDPYLIYRFYVPRWTSINSFAWMLEN